MMPWIRPNPDSQFIAEADPLLQTVRKDVAARGHPLGSDFDNKEIWTASWKRPGRRPGIHKETLAGPDPRRVKCVWCERILTLKGELDVEHYRPKSFVTRWDGSPDPLADKPPREKDVGYGYWWLAFTWTNYSLACGICNRLFKRNLFPVVEPRLAITEGVERLEKPLLIDPAMTFVVRDHFRWTNDGIIEGVSEEGRATIVTCGLNRAELRGARAQVAQNTLAQVKLFDVAWEKQNLDDCDRAWTNLGLLGARTSEFTSMVRWLVEEKMGLAWAELEGMPP